MVKLDLQVKKGDDARRFLRVSVILKGALRIPGMGVEMINT